MGRRRRWRRLGLGGSLGALIAAGAVRYDASTGAATTPLLVVAALLFFTALTVAALVLVYVVLTSAKMTRNLVKIIEALRARWG